MITRQGLTDAERKRMMTNCENCGVEVQNGSLKKHMLSKRCMNHNTDFINKTWCVFPLLKQKLILLLFLWMVTTIHNVHIKIALTEQQKGKECVSTLGQGIRMT
jgi:hypothetical protein